MNLKTHYALSNQAQHMKRSMMRELLQHAVDPSIISFATGLPPAECLPVDELRDCMSAVIQRDGASALQYGPPYQELREWIAEHMRSRGVDCGAENIFITSGSQQSLTILSRTFLNPGDVAVVEEITFSGIEKVTVGYGADVRAVATDLNSGVDVGDLEDAFNQPIRPKLAVVIPDFHNPLGVSIRSDKRERIARLADGYCIPLIEDDPYSLLRFHGEQPKPIRAYSSDGYAFYLGSFSKMLSPALRLGWMVIPEELFTQVTATREAIDLESSTLIQRTIMEFLRRGLLEPHLEQLRLTLQERCHIMMQALETHLGDVASWTKPDGGLFIWLTLPEHIDAVELVGEAIHNRVVYVPGDVFAVHGSHRNTMRLNFGNVTPDKIEEGIQRLARLIRMQV